LELFGIEGLYEIAWFLGGVIACRFLTRLLNYGHAFILAKLLNIHALQLLGAVAEDIAFIKELKYSTMVESGLVSEREIDLAKEIDERSFESWKKTVINNFIAACPNTFLPLIKFDSWEGAMKELTKIYKNT
jgi:hypothetical protein